VADGADDARQQPHELLAARGLVDLLLLDALAGVVVVAAVEADDLVLALHLLGAVGTARQEALVVDAVGLAVALVVGGGGLGGGGLLLLVGGALPGLGALLGGLGGGRGLDDE